MAELHETAGAADGLEAGLAHFFNANIPALRPLLYERGKKWTGDKKDNGLTRDDFRADSVRAWISNLMRGKNIGFDSPDLGADLIPVCLDCDSREAVALLAERIQEEMPIVQSGSGFRHYHFLLKRETFERLFLGLKLIPDYKLAPEIGLELLNGTQHRPLPESGNCKIRPDAMPGADGSYKFIHACPLPIDPPSAIALIKELLARKKANGAARDRTADNYAAHAPGRKVPAGMRHDAARDAIFRLANDLKLQPTAIAALMAELAQRQFQPYDEPWWDAERWLEEVNRAIAKVDADRPPTAGPRNAVFFHYLREAERQSFLNLLAALGIKIAYNEFTETLEIAQDGGPWRPLVKGDYKGFRTLAAELARPKPEFLVRTADGATDKSVGGEAAKPPVDAFLVFPRRHGAKVDMRYGWRMHESEFASHLDGTGYANRRHSITEWVNGIEEEFKDNNAIDGGLLLDAWVEWGWQPHSAEYEAACSYMLPILLCQLVARARQPGAKTDMLPAIIGPNGIGKSTMLACICPDPESQFMKNYRFLSSFGRGNHAKQAHGEQFIGTLVIENAEMEAFRAVPPSEVLEDLDLQFVKFRRSYGRESSDAYLLAAIRAITHNDNDVIVKPPGTVNRRVLPTKWRSKYSDEEAYKRLTETWRDHRRRLIAHAIRLVDNGGWQELIPKIKAEMVKLTPAHVRTDEVGLDALAEAIAVFDPKQQREGITQREILKLVFDKPKNFERDFGKNIRELGFEGPQRTRKDGRITSLWKLKDGAEPI